MPTPTLTFTQNAVVFPTNESPIVGVTGLPVTIANSLAQAGQYKLDDVPDTSALAEGNIGPSAATSAFTPDVPGGYLVGLYDAAGVVRIARLVFVVPEPTGYVLPPHGATSDVKDPTTGAVTTGNFRPSGSALFKTKGWKTILPLLRKLASVLAASDIGSFEFTLDGDLSLVAALPAIFDPAKRSPSARTIAGVELTRDVAGTAGTTRVDLLVNGVSVFAVDGDKPQIAFGAGALARSYKVPTAAAAVAAGAFVQAELENVEGGNPENIRVTVFFA